MQSLGHILAFRTSSLHSFEHRKPKAWRVAHSNATLLRSNVRTRSQKLRLLYTLARPCLMHASEIWIWSPELLALVIAPHDQQALLLLVRPASFVYLYHFDMKTRSCSYFPSSEIFQIDKIWKVF